MTDPDRTPSRKSDHRWQFPCVCLFIVIASLFVYGKVRNHDFSWFDDTMYVTENQHVHQGITLDNIIWAFGVSKAEERTYWHPLAWLSHMLDWQLFGPNPGPLHLENLLIHIVNALLLLLVLRGMTGALWPSAFAAALFAVHPLNVDTVAWIAERKNVLSTLFWMLAMLAYVYYAKRPSISRYLLVFAAMALGLMAKPMLVTLPCVLLLMDFWPLGRFSWGQQHAPAGPDRFDRAPLGRLVLEKIPLLAIAFVSIGLAAASLRNNSQMVGQHTVPMLLRLENAVVAYVKYLVKIFWPHNLAFYYPFPDFIPLWQVAGAIVVLICLSAMFILPAKKAPYLTVGWLWFLGTLLPVIGIVQGGLWPEMADRWTYVPAIGIFIMISWGGSALVRKRTRLRWATAGAAVGVLLGLMIISRHQVSYWKNRFTLFDHALAVSGKDYLLEYDMGLFFSQEGKLDEAISHYTASLKANPNFDRGYNNLGNALARKDRLAEAVSCYRTALTKNPDNVEARINLADVLVKQGKLDEGDACYRKALERAPDNVLVHKNFAQLLLKQKKSAEAEARLKAALALSPRDPEIYNMLGAAMVGQKKIEDAVSCFKKALEIKPDYAIAKKNLSRVMSLLKSRGRADEAGMGQPVEAAPDDPESEYALGVMYMNRGETDQAISRFQKALALNPEFIDAIYNLGVAYAQKGEYDRSISAFERLISIKPGNAAACYNIACLYARQDRKDEAVEWLKKAVARGYNDWAHLKEDPDLKSIRETKYFRSLASGF